MRVPVRMLVPLARLCGEAHCVRPSPLYPSGRWGSLAVDVPDVTLYVANGAAVMDAPAFTHN
jgi:hypothetical protein